MNGLLTNEFESKLGSRQGDPGSPTHFNVYINGLLEELKNSGLGIDIGQGTRISILVYADDMVLLAENEADLQTLIDIAGEWSRKWRLGINPTKTGVVHFHPKSVPETPIKFRIGEHEIELMHRYKYLGVTLDCHGQVDCIIEQLSGVASRALGAVISKSKDNYNLGFGSFSQLFDSCVVPILDYACGAWNVLSSVTQLTKLDRVQMRAGRFYCGLPKNAANMGVIGELGHHF